MAGVVAAVTAAARRRVITHFMSANAVSADTAIGFDSARHVERRMFDRLQRAGVIRPAPKGYYIDIPTYDEWRNALRHRILWVIAAALFAAGIAIVMLH